MVKAEKRQVVDASVVVLRDRLTGRIIRNSTAQVADMFQGDKNVVLVDVRDKIDELGKHAIALDDDTMPDPRQLPKFAKAFVQYACYIEYNLQAGKDVLVFCKNGRSRSPNVVFLFFVLFRGYTLEGTKKWFKEAYPSQRPATAAASVAFPNFDRFETTIRFVLSNPKKRAFKLEEVVKTCSRQLGGAPLKLRHEISARQQEMLHSTSLPPWERVDTTESKDELEDTGGKRQTRAGTRKKKTDPMTSSSRADFVQTWETEARPGTCDNTKAKDSLTPATHSRRVKIKRRNKGVKCALAAKGSTTRADNKENTAHFPGSANKEISLGNPKEDDTASVSDLCNLLQDRSLEY